MLCSILKQISSDMHSLELVFTQEAYAPRGQISLLSNSSDCISGNICLKIENNL